MVVPTASSHRDPQMEYTSNTPPSNTSPSGVDHLSSPYVLELLSERAADITHRRNSGVEDCWRKARTQFAHGDAEKAAGGWEKGTTLDGSITRGYSEPDGDGRSTVSVNITRPYTNAGTARTADLLLPAGERDNWDIRETPISDLEALRPYFAEQPELLQHLPFKLAAKLQQPPEARKRAIAQCRELIKDYLVETDFASKTRKQIKESGLPGTGILYGPFPEDRKVTTDVQQAVELLVSVVPPEEQEARRFELEMKILKRPALELVPVENIYPDKKCGGSIHNGDHVWQVVPDITKSQLRKLRDASGYVTEELDYLLTQEPEGVKEVGGPKKKSFEIWRRTGEVNLTKLASCQEELDQFRGQLGKTNTLDFDEATDCYEWMQLEFINDRLVKVNALATDSQRLPYNFLVWEERTDSPFGIGIPEQIETPQRGLNMAVRAAQDNLGYSVGFGLIYLEGVIEAMDGDDVEYRPYKVYRALRDQLMALAGKEVNPKDAIQTLEFPNYLDKILPWINYWLQMAEQTTGLPLLLQGQKATDSVGVTNALMGSSTTNLRLFVKHWDDDVCKPVINEMYNWVQLYGPPEAQADAVAQPLGSSILVEKELQQQALLQLLQLAPQPVYGLSPKTLAKRQVEGFGFNYDDVKATDEELEQLQAAAEAPEPAVQVAQIRSETDLQIQQMKDTIAEMKLMLEAQLKGESIEQAREAVQTQGLANIAQETIRSEGEQESQVLSAELDPTNPNVGAAPGPVPAVAPPNQPGASRDSAELVTDEELDALGL